MAHAYPVPAHRERDQVSGGMVIRRSRHAQQFVTVPNELARNTSLSFRARGLLVMLLSLPDGWQVTTTQLGEENPEGRDAIRTALRELRDAGYARVLNSQDERGRWHRQTEVYDTPQPAEAREAVAKPSPRGRVSSPRPDQGELESAQVAPKTAQPSSGKPVLIQNTDNEHGREKHGSSERGPAQTSARGKPRASRADSFTDEAIIASIRRACSIIFGEADEKLMEDEQALELWDDKTTPGQMIGDPVSYFMKIFGDGQSIDTYLQAV
jgi:hypothetical protein